MKLDKKQNRLRRARRGRSKIRELEVNRLSVHRTPRHIYAQVIRPDGGRILVAASSLEAEVRKGIKNGGNVEASGRVVDWDGEPAILSVVLDISQRKRAEESSRNLITAIDAMNDCVTFFDADDRLMFSNEQHRKLNAAAPEMWILGTAFEDQMKALLARGMVPEAQGKEDEWLRERMERHRKPGGPFELSRQDGITMLVHEQRLPGGGMITLATDITERKFVEEQLRQA